MLRLWRDLYRIVLHPERISLVRVRRGHFSEAGEVSAALEIPAGKSPTWQAALDHLDELIAGIRSNKAHFNKAETPAAIGHFIHDYFGRRYIAILGKKFSQVFILCGEPEIANVNVHLE